MSGDQCCSQLKEEFQFKRLGFSDVNFARFIYSQWRWPVGVVVLYRFILSVYTISIQIYSANNQRWDLDTSTEEIPAWAFLTNWTYFVLTLYLFVHFLVVLCFVVRRGRYICSKPVRTHHHQLFHELQEVQRNQYEVVPGTDSDAEEASRDRPRSLAIPKLYKLVWVLYSVASSGCFMVTILYWTMLYTQSNGTNFTDVQLHGITSVIVFIEHLVSAVPIRLFHVIYPLVYGLVYFVFSLLFYTYHPKHPVIYPGVLDFDHPWKTAIVVALIGVVLLPSVQLVFYLIYRVKLWIYRTCCTGASYNFSS